MKQRHLLQDTAVVFTIAIGLWQGCATTGTSSRGDSNDSGWRELAGDHVVLRTNRSPPAAVRALRQLERAYDALFQTMPGSFPPAEQDIRAFVVFLVRNDSEYEHLTSSDRFWLSSFGKRGCFAFPRDLDEPGRSMFINQIASFLIRSAAPGAPPWLQRGLPAFVETMHYSIDEPRVILGEPKLQIVRGPPGRQPSWSNMHVREVLAVHEMNFPDPKGEFRRKNWLLTHYLVNVKPREFNELQRRLHAGEEGAQAWKLVFPSLDLDKLDSDLLEYTRLKPYPVQTFQIPISKVNYAERVLTLAEVHLTRARIYSLERAHLADARQEVAAALKLEPFNPLATEMQKELNEP